MSSKEIEKQGTPGRHSFEINYKVVMGFREIERGYDSLETFAHCVNIPHPMNASSFQKITEKLDEVYLKAAYDSMKQGKSEVRGTENYLLIS